MKQPTSLRVLQKIRKEKKALNLEENKLLYLLEDVKKSLNFYINQYEVLCHEMGSSGRSTPDPIIKRVENAIEKLKKENQ